MEVKGVMLVWLVSDLEWGEVKNANKYCPWISRFITSYSFQAFNPWRYFFLVSKWQLTDSPMKGTLPF